MTYQQVDQQVALDWKAASIGSCDVLWQRPSGDVIEQAKQRIQEIQVTLDSAADEERRRKEEERKKRSGLFLGAA